ncbi:MAG: hypothetical protein J2P57_04480 [Acidimicrobiaceae bacterium]|nr:hypothetical protein [Acidimicrobiaceae bacterium]
MRALPSTKAVKHRRRLFTVNVSNMEVLVAHYDPTDRSDIGGFMNVDGGRSRASLVRALGRERLWKVPYVTATNALSIDFDDLDDLLALLAMREVQDAAKALNDHLRSVGQVPSLQRQWHVPEFATWVAETYPS